MISALLTPHANAQDTSLSLYGGIGAAAPLTSIIRLRELGIEPIYMTTLALAQEISKHTEEFGLEAEGQITWHHGHDGPLALNGALIGRFYSLPWVTTLNGSFGLGAGLSHSFGIPQLEFAERTSRTLLYLMFEYELGIAKSQWSALFRVHHRSGVFGLFDNVTGGSDYLCLGMKVRW